jgi:hypothetical protein
MSNCSSAAKRDNDPEASHLGSVNSVTQAYPQIVTIKSLENFLGESSNPSLKALAIEGLLNASHSRSSTVADLAHSTLNRLNSRGF